MEETKETITALNEKGATETDKPPSCTHQFGTGDACCFLNWLNQHQLNLFGNSTDNKAPVWGL